MAEVKEIKVPDIGDFDSVDVIEVLVKAGDSVAAEDSLITLESDKATMEVPCPEPGTVKEVLVAVGDQVAEGSAVIKLEPAEEQQSDGDGGSDDAASEPAAREQEDTGAAAEAEAPAASRKRAAGGGIEEVKVPDIGDFDSVDVIEILVKAGDSVAAEDSLITLESDKATMEVPAPKAGTVKEVLIEVGAKVSEGTAIVRLEVAGEAEAAEKPAEGEQSSDDGADTESGPKPYEPRAQDSLETDHEPIAREDKGPAPADQPIDPDSHKLAHASPSVRRFARELGVDLGRLEGSGRKGRIRKEDVQAYVKQALGAGAGAAPAAAGAGIPPIPQQDFSRFGEIEEQPLSRIKQKSGPHLQRSWLNVPHVTQFDEADITELEAFRKAEKEAAEKAGVKLTPLAFLVKASAAALVKFPEFNSSLKPSGDALILKKYINIGVAVDTPNGLVVPVIKDAERKGIYTIAGDLATVSGKARDGKLAAGDMQGGTFSISSLGGVGGTAFTPIVNAPEVAILGVSRSSTKPVWNGTEFAPRLMLPLSLSYDHRVVDGAAAARFTSYLATLLGDLRRLIL